MLRLTPAIGAWWKFAFEAPCYVPLAAVLVASSPVLFVLRFSLAAFVADLLRGLLRLAKALRAVPDTDGIGLARGRDFMV